MNDSSARPTKAILLRLALFCFLAGFASRGPLVYSWGADATAAQCALNAKTVLTAIEMKAVDHGSFPGGFFHQSKAGDPWLASFFPDSRYSPIERADLVSEGYLKAESATCPSGGLYTAWFTSRRSVAICSEHGRFADGKFSGGRLTGDALELEDAVFFRGGDWAALLDTRGLTAARRAALVDASWSDLAKPGAFKLTPGVSRFTVAKKLSPGYGVAVDFPFGGSDAEARFRQELESRIPAAAPRPSR
ncbi:MAG: hypothetical protein HYY25_12195 [Candidatus Wallbacteria bacterium]|nr:hypothetical protein [Candidatus Wallbacteria bacterium]